VARSRREIVHWLAMFGAVPRLSRCESESNQEPSYDDAEAYRVYSTLIPQDWIWVSAKAESLVIAALTVSSEMCLEPERQSSRFLAPAIANYRDLAGKRWHLKREFRLSKPYELVDQQEIDGYFRKGGSGWDGFYAHYPKSGGYLFLSPVGFNSAKDIAILQVNHLCGGLCGGGTFSVLQKRDGEWKAISWKGSSCGWAS
jgi:hypothetical protein